MILILEYNVLRPREENGYSTPRVTTFCYNNGHLLDMPVHGLPSVRANQHFQAAKDLGFGPVAGG